MAGREPFDPQRAAFTILCFVIIVYAVVIVAMVGACVYHAEVIILADKDINCDPNNRLMSLMAAALAAALAFAGIRINERGKDKDDKDKKE